MNSKIYFFLLAVQVGVVDSVVSLEKEENPALPFSVLALNPLYLLRPMQDDSGDNDWIYSMYYDVAYFIFPQLKLLAD